MDFVRGIFIPSDIPWVNPFLCELVASFFWGEGRG